MRCEVPTTLNIALLFGRASQNGTFLNLVKSVAVSPQVKPYVTILFFRITAGHGPKPGVSRVSANGKTAGQSRRVRFLEGLRKLP